ncbi:helix-turn-helix domain-containing protein [Marinilactibacillus kalidii]|uniref:helix-turn-helix domain-containing protein n=1 Tax=Marinilactibacillus kalidii TaxID=2820274 RepID=UPI001ABDAE17
MKFSNLKIIYPDAQLVEASTNERSMLSLPYKNKWIQLSKESLSENEIHLLSMLYKKESTYTIQQSSPWYTYLSEKKQTPPKVSGRVRMIQLKLEKKDAQFDPVLWSESAKTLFEPLEDSFFLSDDLYCIIQPTEAAFLNKDEIEGTLQTLEDDFSLKTICYIGQYWDTSSSLRQLLNEEQAIFKQETPHFSGRMGSLTEVSLHYFTAQALSNSTVITILKENINQIEDARELIRALWENQGNVSMAAKSLFVHRNTLQYRIEKFHESTGLALKQIDELALCYLLTL